MITHSLTQGSPEWHAYRAQHFNASDAPAMMGCSPYKTRNQLLKERATGLTEEVDAATQRRFDDGHRYEALARPLAEAVIGDDLFPVTGSEGKYSASFDGLTMDGSTAWEHKSLNEELRAILVAMARMDWNNDAEPGRTLPLHYRVQMEQQCMISGAELVLFTASRWDGDEPADVSHCWYTPDLALRQQIVAGWAQFEADLAAYTHTDAAPKAIAAPVELLPSVLVQVEGRVLSTNLSAYRDAAVAFIAGIKTDLVTDQDFADADAAGKACRDGVTRLASLKEQILAQTATIDEQFKAIDHVSELLRVKALEVERLVKHRKETIKVEIINAAKIKLAEHIQALNARLGRNLMPVIPADFAGALKSKRNIDSQRNAVDTELAKAKIEASATADRIQANLGHDAVVAHPALFADLQTLCLKAVDDFDSVARHRVQNHEAEQARKEEAQREQIRAEELARIERENAATARAAEVAAVTAAAAENAQRAADIADKERITSPVVEARRLPPATQAVVASIAGMPRVPHTTAGSASALRAPFAVAPVAAASRPTDAQIVVVLAQHYRVHESKVIEWLGQMDLVSAAARMAEEFEA